MKYKPLILLFGLSFLILISVGTYQWWQNQQNLNSVIYLSDPDWSEPIEIIPDIYSRTYKLIPEDSALTVFWIKKHKQDKQEEMYVHQVNYHGKQIQKPKLLVQDMALRSMSAELVNDQYHLFWLSGQTEENLTLKYWVLDREFNLIEEQDLIKGLQYARQIKTVIEQQAIYLTWFSTRNSFEQIDLAKLDLITGRFMSREVTNTLLHAEYPNLNIVDGQVHLVWLEQNPEELIRGENEVENRYFLVYQRFDSYLNPIDLSAKLATATLDQYEVAPQIAVSGDQIHLIWRRYDKENQGNRGVPPLVFYHTALDVNNLKNYKIGKITNTNSKEPNLLKTVDGFLFTYIDVDDQLSIKFASINHLGDRTVRGDKLFPGRRQALQPLILEDSVGDQHLVWIEEEVVTKKLYYATTKYPYKPGVLETLGIKFHWKDMQFVSAILYFTVLPLLTVFGNVSFLMTVFIVSIGLSFLSWCSHYRYLGWLKHLQSTYVSYLLILGIVFANSYGNLNRLFYPWSTPRIAPFILIISALAGLFYLYQIHVKRELALLVGGFVSLLFYYWITQANLIFHTHSYFLR